MSLSVDRGLGLYVPALCNLVGMRYRVAERKRVGCRLPGIDVCLLQYIKSSNVSQKPPYSPQISIILLSRNDRNSRNKFGSAFVFAHSSS